MAEKIKVGVIGVGALGRHHARLYEQCADAELVGVYDLDEEQARKIADEMETVLFSDPVELAERVEGLSIAVPTDRHFEVAKTMLEKGKHLLLEKPITQTIEEARELLRMAEERRLIIHVGHVERFNPVISYLEQRINDPRFIECHRLASYPPPRPGQPPRGTEVGVVLDLMIHDIDMVLNLVKSPVESIDSVGIPVLSPTEDIANARIRFQNGCVANLTASRLTPTPMRKIRVFQHDCYLSLDYHAKTGVAYFKQGGGIAMEEVPINDHNALLKELEHFVACIADLETTGEMPTPKVSGEHGMRALDMALTISETIKTGGGTLEVSS